MADESQTLVDMVTVEATVTGPKDGLLEMALKAIEPIRRESVVGLTGRAEDKPQNVWYVVGLTQNAEANSPAQKATGESGTSYDDAYAKASNGGALAHDAANVTLTVREKYGVPYNLVKVSGFGYTKREMLEALKAAEDKLTGSFGATLVRKPESVEFTCRIFNGPYHPKEDKQDGSEIGVGTSTKCAKEAEDNAKESVAKKKQIKATRFEGVEAFKVYGISAFEAASSGLSAQKNYRTRSAIIYSGGPTAAETPERYEPMYQLV